MQQVIPNNNITFISARLGKVIGANIVR